MPGENYFSTSDIGWVVGHSYIVYGPLIAGMGTIMYEGTPIRPDGGIWWSIVEKYKVTSMFSSPTAIRVLKKQDPALLKKYDLSSLRLLFLAGEPLDEPTGALDRRRHRQAHHRQLLADRNGLADPRHPARRRGAAVEVRLARAALLRLQREDLQRGDRRGDHRPSREGRGRDRRSAAAGMHDRPSGATTSASSRPTGRAFRTGRSIRPSTGVSATRTATSSSSAGPTT